MVDFQETVIKRSHEIPVVVDFWAEWCGPCRVLGPTIEQLAAEAGGRWELVKVNTEHQQELAQQYQIMSIPAVKMFHQGEIIAEFAGALPKPQIQRWLDTHIPDPRLAELTQLLHALDKGEVERLEDLRAFVDRFPDLMEARLALAKWTFMGDADTALDLLAGIQIGHPAFDQAEHIRTLVAFAKHTPTEGHPKVLEAMGLAQQAWEARDMDQTLKQLIQAVMLDKTYHKELPRKATIALFNYLGEQHELTKQHRPFFNMALY